MQRRDVRNIWEIVLLGFYVLRIERSNKTSYKVSSISSSISLLIEILSAFKKCPGLNVDCKV